MDKNSVGYFFCVLNRTKPMKTDAAMLREDWCDSANEKQMKRHKTSDIISSSDF